eukprot:Amastigsp_a6162_56.p4 type:complete len:203 gc:universal Amastigsp_a6162_56:646-38(-)
MLLDDAREELHQIVSCLCACLHENDARGARRRTQGACALLALCGGDLALGLQIAFVADDGHDNVGEADGARCKAQRKRPDERPTTPPRTHTCKPLPASRLQVSDVRLEIVKCRQIVDGVHEDERLAFAHVNVAHLRERSLHACRVENVHFDHVLADRSENGVRVFKSRIILFHELFVHELDHERRLADRSAPENDQLDLDVS